MPTRTERDSFGTVEVPAERLWGAQTQRSLQYFHISSERMPPEIILALAAVTAAGCGTWPSRWAVRGWRG